MRTRNKERAGESPPHYKKEETKMKKYLVTMTKAGKSQPYYHEVVSEDKLFDDLPRTGRTEYTYATAADLLEAEMRLAVENAGAEDAKEAKRLITETAKEFFEAIPSKYAGIRLDELHALKWLKGNGESGYAIGSDPAYIVQEYFRDVQDAETWNIEEADA